MKRSATFEAEPRTKPPGRRLHQDNDHRAYALSGFFSRAWCLHTTKPPRAMKNCIMTFPQLLMNFKTMKTIDTLTLKALELKQTIEGISPLTDHLLDKALQANPEQKELRNICAFISSDLFAKVEQTCINLSLSKRQLIEMALIDIIEKANEIIERHDVFEGLNNTKGE
jgi:hypothetical protein